MNCELVVNNTNKITLPCRYNKLRERRNPMLGTPSVFREFFERLCGIMSLFLIFNIFDNHSHGTIIHSSLPIRRGISSCIIIASSLTKARTSMGCRADALPTEPRRTLIFENAVSFSPPSTVLSKWHIKI
jgi:hypothetical protein